MEEKISVIVPVYNVEKYIHKCVDSIVNQTYKNVEIILVNDGSTDRCGRICDEYAKKDKRIKVIHKENEGAGVARNIGIENAKGKFIIFVDSDDWVESTALFDLMEKYSQTESELICSSYNHHSPKGIKTKIFTDKLYANVNIGEGIIDNWSGFNSPWAKLYCTELIKANRIYFSKDIAVGEDTIFNLEYVKYCTKILFTHQITYNYNCMVENQLTSRYHSEFNKYIYEISKKVAELGSVSNKKLYSHIKEMCRYALEHYAGHLKHNDECFNKMNESIDLFESILKEKKCKRKYPDSIIYIYLIRHGQISLFYFLCRVVRRIKAIRTKLLNMFQERHKR